MRRRGTPCSSRRSAKTSPQSLLPQSPLAPRSIRAKIRAQSTKNGELRHPATAKTAAGVTASPPARPIDPWPPNPDPTDEIRSSPSQNPRVLVNPIHFDKRAPQYSRNKSAVHPCSIVIAKESFFFCFNPFSFTKSKPPSLALPLAS